MKITFHDNAKKNFDEKAQALLLELGPITVDESKSEFEPEFVSTVTITDADIVGTPTFQIGEDTKVFICNKRRIGLSGPAHRDFLRLVDHIFRNPACRERVSFKTIEDNAFKWMGERYSGKSNENLTDYLINKLEILIDKQTVYVPIAATAIESEVQIGKVLFKQLSISMIDEWQLKCPPKDEKALENFNQFFKKKREELQGYAIGILEIEAEPDHAQDVAVELVEQAVSFLRVFSIVNTNVRLASYTRIKGRESFQQTESIVTGRESLHFSSSLISPRPHQWLIDDNMMNLMLEEGLSIISELLVNPNPTAFQKKILDALSIYSKSSLEHEPEAKLIYIFSSLETLLLKSESEPIQHNIGERMAFLIREDKNSRKKIIQNVKEVYGYRSRFFHHGHGMEEIESISEFMTSAWESILLIVKNSDRFETKDEFISAIEDMKLS